MTIVWVAAYMFVGLVVAVLYVNHREPEMLNDITRPKGWEPVFPAAAWFVVLATAAMWPAIVGVTLVGLVMTVPIKAIIRFVQRGEVDH